MLVQGKVRVVEESLTVKKGDVSTSLDMTRSLLEDRRTVWVIAGLIVFLFAIANLPWQLDDYDQAKQAFTPFEMIKEGRWFYQLTPHEHVATKPPLVGWISAGLFAITRSWDVAWRLPSFLAAIAIAFLLFRAAHSMDALRSARLAPGRGDYEGKGSSYGAITGVIALSAFALNLLSPRLATLVRTDMPLALVIFLIGLLIWQKVRNQEAWRTQDRVYLFVVLTAAMLIKGPIVYAFLLPGIVIFQWRYGRARPELVLSEAEGGAPLRNHSAWSGPPQDGFAVANWWPWIASLAVFLLWLVGGILFQPGFFDQVVMREFVARFSETIHRPQPLYFYLPHLLHKFAPWSVVMIVIAVADLHWRKWWPGLVFRDMSPETFWLLWWGIGGLIAMSLIPSKRVDRIFPVIPPLCLLLAVQVSGRIGALRRPDIAARCPYLSAALAFAILFTGGYTIFKVATEYRNHHNALVVFGRNVRKEAEAHHWRYEVVPTKDEALLLYLQKTHFIDFDRAVAEWNRGNLDALVAPAEKAPAFMRELCDAALSELKSDEKKEERGGEYVLIMR